jgi:D-beta-D-heptose 7-phosphate kinase/D-beta-D-heptose 1-phosphate adenosyltransferase
VQSWLQAAASRHVVVLGDVMLDRFEQGTVERISPEAPIPVLRLVERRSMVGGAGNVAANIGALGGNCRLVGVVGTDEEAASLRALADSLPGCTPFLIAEPARPTTVKTRLVAGAQQLLRVDRETAAAIAPATETALLAALIAALEGAAVLVLSDYGKGVLTQALIEAAIEAARAKAVPVLVDPKGADFSRYRGASVVTPNAGELAAAARLSVGDDASTVAAARALIAAHGFGAVVATRGRQGLSIVEATSETHVPAQAREVFDVSGAGDTVMATLAVSLAGGAPLVEAARLANRAAGIVVGKVGTATVKAAELDAETAAESRHAAEAKILDRAAMLETAARWRRQGLRIGFTNGCFDLLHPGHIHLLTQARGFCDRLVVGLNSDESVKRLKGPARPVQGEWARATVLAALAAVDAVVLFAEDTPEALIEALKPDVLVKGADYTIETVVGGRFVQSYGGEVRLAELLPGHSTTRTVAQLQK